MKKILTLIMLLFIISVLSISAQSIQKQTEVMVLGTTHLQQLGSKFNPEMLEEVLAELDMLDFDAICIENMPGQLLYDIQSRNDSAYSDVLEGFGGNRLKLAERYQEVLGIDYLTAIGNVELILSEGEIKDSDRAELIFNMIAGTDLASAVLQHQFLTDKSLLQDKDLNVQLDKLYLSSNEIYSLACRLATREDIQKLEYIDNFQDEAILMSRFPEFISDYMARQEKLANIGNQAVYKKLADITKKCIADNNLIELYRFVNSDEYMEDDVDSQWNIWLSTDFPSGTDRSRLYLWEMRNLQIAANIMHTAAFYPGKRILVIIGSSHKAFLEKYLSNTTDIDLLKF